MPGPTDSGSSDPVAEPEPAVERGDGTPDETPDETPGVGAHERADDRAEDWTRVPEGDPSTESTGGGVDGRSEDAAGTRAGSAFGGSSGPVELLPPVAAEVLPVGDGAGRGGSGPGSLGMEAPEDLGPRDAGRGVARAGFGDDERGAVEDTGPVERAIDADAPPDDRLARRQVRGGDTAADGPSEDELALGRVAGGNAAAPDDQLALGGEPDADPAADGPADDRSAPGRSIDGDTAEDAAAQGDGAAHDGAADAAAQDDGAAKEAAPKRTGDGVSRRVPGWSRSPAAILVGVLIGLLGFGLAVQVRSNTSTSGLPAARQEDLVRILDDLSSREDRLRRQIAELEAARSRLSTTGDSSSTALEEARKRSDALGILAGTVAAQGPGIELTLTDPGHRLAAEDLLDTVEELRAAGAEAIQVGGVRIGLDSSFTGTDRGIAVDGVAVTVPYTILAIGDPPTLATAMGIPGGVADTAQRAGGEAHTEQRQRVVIRALRVVKTPRYSQPTN